MPFRVVLRGPIEPAHDRAFNVGSTTGNYLIRDLAGLVAESIPGLRCGIRNGRFIGRPKLPRSTATVSNAELGFRTRWTARDGIRELADAYRIEGLTLAQFQGPRYQRIAQIQRLRSQGRLDDTLRWRSSVSRTVTGSRRGHARAEASRGE